jgi:hypothetical protein
LINLAGLKVFINNKVGIMFSGNRQLKNPHPKKLFRTRHRILKETIEEVKVE